MHVPGAQYSFVREIGNSRVNYTGIGTPMDLKIHPYIQYQLMKAWELPQYKMFLAAFVPLALLPLMVWIVMCFKNSKLKPAVLLKEKPKTDKKHKKKH